MPGILPDLETAGAVVYRTIDGIATHPPDVVNAYPPAPPFHATCDLTALPTNCDARIEPKQINAIVSELLSLAECWDPFGTWDCDQSEPWCAAFPPWAMRHNPLLAPLVIRVATQPSIIAQLGMNRIVAICLTVTRRR